MSAVQLRDRRGRPVAEHETDMRAVDDLNRDTHRVWAHPAEVSLRECLTWVNANARSLVWARFRYWKSRIGLGDPLSSIEVGCGYGKISMLIGLAGARVTLLDYSSDAVRAAVHAHELLGLHPQGVAADMLALPASMDGCFDVACSFGTLEHFSGSHRLRAFEANARLLRPGGILFFVVPNRFGVFYRAALGVLKLVGKFPRDFHEEPFSRGELLRMAAACRLEALEVEGIGTLIEDFRYWILQNLRAAVRRLLRLQRGTPVPAASVTDVNAISLSQEIRDCRSWLDRRYSAGWLFVARKVCPPDGGTAADGHGTHCVGTP